MERMGSIIDLSIRKYEKYFTLNFNYYWSSVYRVKNRSFSCWRLRRLKSLGTDGVGLYFFTISYQDSALLVCRTLTHSHCFRWMYFFDSPLPHLDFCPFSVFNHQCCIVFVYANICSGSGWLDSFFNGVRHTVWTHKWSIFVSYYTIYG